MELTEEESGAPNSADSASNENGDTGINREFVVGPTLDAAKFVKTSNKVRIEQVISEYEKVVLKNRKDDVDNDVSPLANTSSSSALREQLHCRTALSKASVPFHPVVQQGINKTNISVKSTQFYVNSCYPGETPQLSSTWKLLSSIAEPKSKVDEDKEGEDRKSSEENKGLSSNEEVPDTIPYVLVPSMAIQEGLSQDSKEAAATAGEKGGLKNDDDFNDDKGHSLHRSRGSHKDDDNDTHSSKK